MKVTVRFFSSLREQLGMSVHVHETTTTTLAGLRAELISADPAFAQALAYGKAIRMAINHEVCEETAVLSQGCEIAFFPPVTGG
jgi:molybdopterin synthase sulfur carrier subunit